MALTKTRPVVGGVVTVKLPVSDTLPVVPAVTAQAPVDMVCSTALARPVLSTSAGEGVAVPQGEEKVTGTELDEAITPLTCTATLTVSDCPCCTLAGDTWKSDSPTAPEVMAKSSALDRVTFSSDALAVATTPPAALTEAGDTRMSMTPISSVNPMPEVGTRTASGASSATVTRV